MSILSSPLFLFSSFPLFLFFSFPLLLLVKHVDERNQEEGHGGHGGGGGGGGGGDGDVTKCTVWVQYLELYLDNFRDLLAPKANKPINIHEDGARGVFVSGARTIEVKT